MAALDSITDFLPRFPSAGPNANANAADPIVSEDDTDFMHSVEVESDGQMWGKDGFTFADLLDVINPLQHLPVIGQIYRGLTGDLISPGARLAGGTLFGGPIGFALAVANNAVESATGRDIGDNMVAMVSGGLSAGPVDDGQTTAIAALGQDKPIGPQAAAAPNAGKPDASPSAITTAVLPPLGQSAAKIPVRGDRKEVLAAKALPLQQVPVRLVRSPRPAQGLPAAALRAQARPMPSLPGASSSLVAPIPSMSPAAFQTLMNSIGAVPAAQPSGRPGLSAGADQAILPSNDVLGSAMAVHNILKAYAAGVPGTARSLAR